MLTTILSRMRRDELLRKTLRFLLEDAVEGEQPEPASIPFDTSGNFVPWPEETRSIPYEGTADYGPGELRLARIMSEDGVAVAPAGRTSTFDLESPDGSRWEVKAPNQNGKIRMGGESTAAAANSKDEIQRVARQVVKAYNLLRSNPSLLEEDEEDVAFKLENFVSGENMSNIGKGNITPTRMVMLKDVITSLVNLQARLEDKTWNVSLGGKDYDVDTKTLARIIDALGVSPVEAGLDASDRLLALFQGEAFEDVDRWYDKYWTNMFPPHVAFSKVTGLVLVNPAGYMVLGPEKFSSAVVFHELSAMRVVYDVTVPPFGKDKAKRPAPAAPRPRKKVKFAA